MLIKNFIITASFISAIYASTESQMNGHDVGNQSEIIRQHNPYATYQKFDIFDASEQSNDRFSELEMPSNQIYQHNPYATYQNFNMPNVREQFKGSFFDASEQSNDEFLYPHEQTEISSNEYDSRGNTPCFSVNEGSPYASSKEGTSPLDDGKLNFDDVPNDETIGSPALSIYDDVELPVLPIYDDAMELPVLPTYNEALKSSVLPTYNEALKSLGILPIFAKEGNKYVFRFCLYS
ncbi:MAG: hypothetical protein HEEMFOPI_00807 [Holosporales bacterium]